MVARQSGKSDQRGRLLKSSGNVMKRVFFVCLGIVVAGCVFVGLIKLNDDLVARAHERGRHFVSVWFQVNAHIGDYDEAPERLEDVFVGGWHDSMLAPFEGGLVYERTGTATFVLVEVPYRRVSLFEVDGLRAVGSSAPVWQESGRRAFK